MRIIRFGHLNNHFTHRFMFWPMFNLKFSKKKSFKKKILQFRFSYRRQYHSRWQREQRLVACSPQIAHLGDSFINVSRISKFIVFAQLLDKKFNYLNTEHQIYRAAYCRASASVGFKTVLACFSAISCHWFLYFRIIRSYNSAT